jgi:hypothetical protein
MAAKLKLELTDPGYITLPTSLFPNLTGAQIPAFRTLFTEFFERRCLPNETLMTISDFIDPEIGTLDLVKLGWWDTLCSYFSIDPCFHISFSTSAADWHVIYHSLSTFAEMRDFCDKLEKWSVKRGAENMHQELARRIALAKGGGTVDPVLFAKLCRLEGEQLRIESMMWDGLEVDLDEYECGICVVNPGFEGDSFAEEVEE